MMSATFFAQFSVRMMQLHPLKPKVRIFHFRRSITHYFTKIFLMVAFHTNFDVKLWWLMNSGAYICLASVLNSLDPMETCPSVTEKNVFHSNSDLFLLQQLLAFVQMYRERCKGGQFFRWFSQNSLDYRSIWATTLLQVVRCTKACTRSRTWERTHTHTQGLEVGGLLFEVKAINVNHDVLFSLSVLFRQWWVVWENESVISINYPRWQMKMVFQPKIAIVRSDIAVCIWSTCLWLICLKWSCYESSNVLRSVSAVVAVMMISSMIWHVDGTTKNNKLSLYVHTPITVGLFWIFTQSSTEWSKISDGLGVISLCFWGSTYHRDTGKKYEIKDGTPWCFRS